MRLEQTNMWSDSFDQSKQLENIVKTGNNLIHLFTGDHVGG